MIRRLRLTQENLDKIQEVIDKVEGRLKTYYLSAGFLLDKVQRWEQNAFYPPKSSLIGVKLKVQASATKVANAYKYAPIETVVYLEHDTVGWYLVEVRQEVIIEHGWTVEATPTEALKKYLLYTGTRV